MAVRNCLECQQAQFKSGAEGSTPGTVLGTSKSAAAQASGLNLVLTLSLCSFTSSDARQLQPLCRSLTPACRYRISSHPIMLPCRLLFVTPDKAFAIAPLI